MSRMTIIALSVATTLVAAAFAPTAALAEHGYGWGHHHHGCLKVIEHRLAEVESELHRLRLLRDRLQQLLHQPPPAETANCVCPLIENSR
jgi:hypothetical protein